MEQLERALIRAGCAGKDHPYRKRRGERRDKDQRAKERQVALGAFIPFSVSGLWVEERGGGHVVRHLRTNRKRFLKRYTNHVIRRGENVPLKGNSYRKAVELQWMLW